MNPIEKTRSIEQERHALSNTDIKVILGNIVGSMKNFKSAKDGRSSNYWKNAVEHWVEVARHVLKDKDPEFLKVEALERAKTEFREHLEGLRKIEEDGIDIVVDDLIARFDVITETTRVNDLTAVKVHIIERIREINKSILLLVKGTEEYNILRGRLDELIELNNLIPK